MKFIPLLIAVNICFMPFSFAKNLKKQINSDESVVSWLGRKKLIESKHFGKIKIKEGHVLVDEKGQLQFSEVIIDMTSITCEDLKNRKKRAKLVKHLSSSDFFDAEKYPTAHLVVNKFIESDMIGPRAFNEKSGKKGEVQKGTVYKARGTLKIKNQTKDLNFRITSYNEGEVIRAIGEVEIDRTHWGIKYGSGNFFKNLVANRIIADEIQIEFNIVTKK